MEEDETQSSGNMIPLALALLAIALGGAGLYFGLTANQQLAPIQDSVSEGSTNLAEVNKLAEGYQTRINELNARVKELESTLGRMRAYGNERDKAIKSLASALEANNKQTNKLSKQLTEVVEAGFRAPAAAPVTPAAVASSSSSSAEPAGSSAPAASTPAGTYKIQSGDTFGRIATRQGVDLNALLDANPGVNPTSLQIGQTINIPAN